MRRMDCIRFALQRQIVRYMNLSFSQEGEDIILSELLNGRKTGFFVDFGALHPIRFSNTYKLYLSGWRGVNIDATPGKMKAFEKYRPEDVNVEAAVSHTGGGDMSTLYRFDDGAVDTFDPDLAELYISCGSKLIEKISVPTYNVMELLDKYVPAGQRIDMIDIDVEGLDEIIVCDIDWNKYHPEIVLAESLVEKEETEDMIYTTLRKNGYRLAAKTQRTGIYVSR